MRMTSPTDLRLLSIIWKVFEGKIRGNICPHHDDKKKVNGVNSLIIAWYLGHRVHGDEVSTC